MRPPQRPRRGVTEHIRPYAHLVRPRPRDHTAGRERRGVGWMTQTQRRVDFLFLNLGHFFAHFLILVYATVAMAIAVDRQVDIPGLVAEWDMSYADLVLFSTAGFVAFGLFSLPAGWLADRWSRPGMIAVFFLGAAIFWSGFEQAGSTLNLFAKRYTDRTFLGELFENAERETVDVSYTTEELAPGTYDGTLTIESETATNQTTIAEQILNLLWRGIGSNIVILWVMLPQNQITDGATHQVGLIARFMQTIQHFQCRLVHIFTRYIMSCTIIDHRLTAGWITWFYIFFRHRMREMFSTCLSIKTSRMLLLA